MGNSRILNKNFISTLLYYVTKEAISKYLQVVTNGAQMELTSYHTCRVIATFLPSFQFFSNFRVPSLFFLSAPSSSPTCTVYFSSLFSSHLSSQLFSEFIYIVLFSFFPGLLYLLIGKFIRRGCEKNTGALLDHTENELESVDCVSVLQYQLCSNPG